MKRIVKKFIIILSTSIILVGCTSKANNQNALESSLNAASSQIALSSEPLNPDQIDSAYYNYENSKYGYIFSYPAYMEIVSESENKDSVKLIDAYGSELTVWATINAENKSIKYYLDDVKTKVTGVIDSYIDDFSYEISYKGNAADSSERYNYFEAGFIDGDNIIRFVYKYNAKESDIFRTKARYMSEKLVELNSNL